MFTKDLERLVRSMNAQRLDPEYIRYYIVDTYQLTAKQVDEIFALVGVGLKKSRQPGARIAPKRPEFH
ncbi:MAG: hypothetical protein H0X38_10780 [Planctomycetes bacterium]|nr:hypothetical protein [Planctomycetota bacterium]